jgi:hypothetical protein
LIGVSGLGALSHAAWMADDHPKMAAAFGLISCRLSSWEESKGMAEELEFFRAASSLCSSINRLCCYGETVQKLAKRSCAPELFF